MNRKRFEKLGGNENENKKPLKNIYFACKLWISFLNEFSKNITDWNCKYRCPVGFRHFTVTVFANQFYWTFYLYNFFLGFLSL